jgi:hypothetical protein
MSLPLSVGMKADSLRPSRPTAKVIAGVEQDPKSAAPVAGAVAPPFPEAGAVAPPFPVAGAVAPFPVAGAVAGGVTAPLPVPGTFARDQYLSDTTECHLTALPWLSI